MQIRQHTELPDSRPDEWVAPTAAIRLLPGTGFPEHHHDTHQLCLAADGVLVLGVGARSWALPRSRGLWIPATVPHRVGTLGGTSMLALRFEPARCPVSWAAPTTFVVDELVGGLVRRLVTSLPPDERRRSEAVLFDLLRPVDVDGSGDRGPVVDLPLPADDRARRVAEALVADPSDTRTLQAWGVEVGASDRTLLRAFQAGTGLGFGEWRTRARVVVALPMLADGVPVSVTAGRVGFGSASSLGAAFRRVLGQPPSAYLP